MKKFLPLILIVLLVAGGWFYLAGKKKVAAPAGENNTAAAPQAEKKNVISSIKEAMGLGQTMQCAYVSGSGEQAVTSTVYVAGTKFKTETQASGTMMTVLSDGETQYVWNSATKQGFSMSKACLDELKNWAPQTKTDSGSTRAKPEDYQAGFDSAQNVNCQPATGVDFAVPQDVTFTDQCVMMKQATQMMQQAKGSLPAGVTIPGY